jgi:type II secretory pathway component PulJ
MRNVSGYLTEDGKFFTDKKEAEAHERLAVMDKHIRQFVEMHYKGASSVVEYLRHWEQYRSEVSK